MDAEWLRRLCLSFPGTTEQIQWGYDLLFKVGGKMFAVTPLEPALFQRRTWRARSGWRCKRGTR